MSPHHRQRTRKLIIQALYQWAMSHTEINKLTEQYLAEENPKKIDTDYFNQCLLGVINNLDEIDQHLQPVSERPLEDLDPIEANVLRLAVYEFIYCLDVPYRVVINEAVRLTKMFGATDSYKYINGVLDKLAKKLRQSEMQ